MSNSNPTPMPDDAPPAPDASTDRGTLPEMYDGWLADGRAVLILATDKDTLYRIRIEPVDSESGAKRARLLLNHLGAHFLDGLRATAPFEAILPLEPGLPRRL